MMPWVLAAAIAVSGVAGYRMGAGAEQTRAALQLAEAQRQTLRAAETASRVEAARLILQAERDALAQTLEDAAHADPYAASVALGADSVRRINQR